MDLDSRRTIIVFNLLEEVWSVLRKSGIQSEEIFPYRDSESTLEMMLPAEGFVGFVLGIDLGAQAKIAAENLVAVCASSDKVPPVLAISALPVSKVSTEIAGEIISLECTYTIDLTDVRTNAEGIIASFLAKHSSEPRYLAPAKHSLNSLWRKAVKVYRHDRANSLRRIHEFIRHNDSDRMRRYVGRHGEGLVRSLDMMRQDLFLSAKRYLIGNKQAVATVERLLNTDRVSFGHLLETVDDETIEGFLRTSAKLHDCLHGSWEEFYPEEQNR